jgi:DNA-binding MarR family transcriptional regulator
VSRFYDKHLDACGLRSTQFAVLAGLSQTEPATITELSELLGTDHSTLVRNVRLLAERGWLSNERGRDKRTRELKLTPAGRQKLTDAIPLWREAQEKVLVALGQDTWTQTVTALGALRAVADGADVQP